VTCQSHVCSNTITNNNVVCLYSFHHNNVNTIDFCSGGSDDKLMHFCIFFCCETWIKRMLVKTENSEQLFKCQSSTVALLSIQAGNNIHYTYMNTNYVWMQHQFNTFVAEYRRSHTNIKDSGDDKRCRLFTQQNYKTLRTKANNADNADLLFIHPWITVINGTMFTLLLSWRSHRESVPRPCTVKHNFFDAS